VSGASLWKDNTMIRKMMCGVAAVGGSLGYAGAAFAQPL
jgi:hypothetical protein